MSNKLKLEVVLAAIDKATRPLKGISSVSKETSKELRELQGKLRTLNQQNETLKKFSDNARGLAVTKNKLKTASDEVMRLRDAMKQARAPIDAMATAMQRANAMGDEMPPTRKMAEAVKEAEKQIKALEPALKRAEAESRSLAMTHGKLVEKDLRLKSAIEAAGLSTKGLTEQQRKLAPEISQATIALEKQKAALAKVNEQQRKLHATRAQYDKSMATRDKAASFGVGSIAAGAATTLPIAASIKAYSSYEDAMLGVARQVQGARDDNGKLTKTYYEIGDAIKAMATRIPLATTEIAAIVEAGARMGIQGKANLLTFAETTAKTASAFDLPVDQIGESMGKLSQLYKIPIASISQLGDVINYLDDNALSKGGDIIEVMQRIAGTAATVKMSYQDAAALGSSFLSMGASAEIAATASNAMMRELAIASMQPKRFQAGIHALGMESSKVQAAMSKDATGTILSVLNAINKLPQAKQLEVTTQLFGKEYGDDAAKLASNVAEYRRQLGLTRSSGAKGSMDREASARNDVLSSRYQMGKNQLFNVASELGQSLRPELIGIMNAVGGMLSAINTWVKANPALAAGLIKTVAVLGILLTILGGAALAVAAFLGPIAMAKMAMTTLGISIGGGIGPLGMLGNALKWLGGMFATVGRMLLMNPIGLTITAIAVAAFLIWKYWEPIWAFFVGLWSRVTAVFSSGVLGISAQIINWSPLGLFYQAFASVLKWFGIDLPSNIVDGFIKGLTAMFPAAMAKMKELASQLPGPIKTVLGIHSPSRVFAALGGHTMDGLALGLNDNQNGPLSAVANVAKRLTAAGAGLALSAGTVMAGQLDTRPAMTSTNPAGRTSASQSASAAALPPMEFHIHAAPGMDEKALARLVQQEVAKALRGQPARSNSLTDRD